MSKLSLLVLLAITNVQSAVYDNHQEVAECTDYGGAYNVCTTNQQLISVDENTKNDVVKLILNITSIAKDAFRNLKTDHLTIDPGEGYDQRYVDIEPGTFSNLSSLRTLELSHMCVKLSPNPFDYLADLNLTYFSIDHHNLSAITTSTLSTINENLETLKLCDGSITSIEPKSFERFRHLKYLDLSFNPLQNLLPGTFDGIDQLEVLGLSACDLPTVPGDVMNNLHQLKNLSVGWNSFETLSANDFLHLGGLQDLNLEFNSGIKTLVPGTFDGLKQLRRMDLSACSLNTVEKNVFNDMPSLEILDLQVNNIETIEANAFSGMNLKELNLQSNNIRTILDNAFSGLNVTKLLLYRNDITDVKENAFSGCIVETIRLSEPLVNSINKTSWGLMESVCLEPFFETLI